MKRKVKRCVCSKNGYEIQENYRIDLDTGEDKCIQYGTCSSCGCTFELEKK